MKNNPPLYKLKKMRQKEKMTVREIAEKLGISKSMYSYVENGNERLSYELAEKIAKLFDMNPDDIFYEDYNEFYTKKNI